MASQTSNLFSLARSKLHLSLVSKGDCSLHRWVLNKNFMNKSFPQPTTALAPVNATAPTSAYVPEEEEENVEEESFSFMFPDAGELADARANVSGSESEWLDSLLDSLGDDDDDDDDYASGHASAHHTDDEEDQPLSPMLSPVSSSDNLADHYPQPVSVECYPHPVPYPPFHPPHVRSHVSPSLDSCSTSHDDPDLDDLIEDDSDDESDIPTTPSLITSNTSLDDSVRTSVSEVSNSRSPRVYDDADEPCFLSRFHLNSHNSFYPNYHDC